LFELVVVVMVGGSSEASVRHIVWTVCRSVPLVIEAFCVPIDSSVIGFDIAASEALADLASFVQISNRKIIVACAAFALLDTVLVLKELSVSSQTVSVVIIKVSWATRSSDLSNLISIWRPVDNHLILASSGTGLETTVVEFVEAFGVRNAEKSTSVIHGSSADVTHVVIIESELVCVAVIDRA